MDLPPDRQVRADLLAVRRVLTPNGFTIRLAETPDGRHADAASAISLGLMKCVEPPIVSVDADPDERINRVWAAHRDRERFPDEWEPLEWEPLNSIDELARQWQERKDAEW